MTPEEARKLLERFDPETSTVEDANRRAFLDYQMLAAVMKGPRAAEIAELHHGAVAAKHAGDAATEQALLAKRNAILEEIHEEFSGQLDEAIAAGMEPPWQSWPT